MIPQAVHYCIIPPTRVFAAIARQILFSHEHANLNAAKQCFILFHYKFRGFNHISALSDFLGLYIHDKAVNFFVSCLQIVYHNHSLMTTDDDRKSVCEW